MKPTVKFISLISVLSALASPAYAGEVLDIRNFIGTVDIVTGDFDKISIAQADGAHVTTEPGRTRIDDNQKVNNRNCRIRKSKVKIGDGNWSLAKRGTYKDLDTFPKLKIQAPRFTHIIIDDSIIFGTIGDVASGDIEVRSCGDLQLGNFAGKLELGISGSGDVDMKSAARGEVSISGSGDLEAGNFKSLRLKISGSGDAEIEDVNGDVAIESSGAGDIEMGDIRGDLRYRGSGSSDLEIESVVGNIIEIEVSGSGDVSIENGKVENVFIRASGASDIKYGGTSVNAKARASGASDIYIRKPSGNLESHDSGAAEVNVKG